MLELRALACRRGEHMLFEGVSRHLGAGDLLRVTGANGAGKTTLLRTLCGLAAPEHGSVLWRGETVTTLREEFHRELVYLGHAPALKGDLSAVENLRAACALAGAQAQPAAIEGALAKAGLAVQRHIPVRRLSQGQARRVALARLPLARQAPLWVLDEPFNALDAAASDWLAGVLAAHLASGGLVVLTSHQGIAGLEALAPQEIAL